MKDGFPASHRVVLTLAAAWRWPPEGRHLQAGTRRWAPDRAIATPLRGLRPSELVTSGVSRASQAQQPQRAPEGAPIHYERHRPEQTTLYRLVQQHAASFIAHTEAIKVDEGHGARMAVVLGNPMMHLVR